VWAGSKSSMAHSLQLSVVARGLLALFALFVTACNSPRSAALTTDSITADGGPVTIRPITHGSVEVTHGADVIFVDPAAPPRLYAALPKATLILITHDHEDHFDAGIISAISTASTIVVVGRSLDGHVNKAVTMRNGDEHVFGNLKVAAVPMYNTASSFHVKGDGNGYVVTVGGKRLYFAGDTECVVDPQALEQIEAAFLPMNLPFTMSPAQAADCARQFRPKIVFPYHYRPSNPDDFVKAMAGSGIDVRLRTWY
jgi:L-ascorbate metabolism protein UlaG (beta-lactamase superfamily)